MSRDPRPKNRTLNLLIAAVCTALPAQAPAFNATHGLSSGQQAPSDKQIDEFCNKRYPALMESPNTTADVRRQAEKLYKQHCISKPAPGRTEPEDEPDGKIRRVEAPDGLAGTSEVRVQGKNLRRGDLQCRLESKGRRRTLHAYSRTDGEYRFRVNNVLGQLPGPDYRVECELADQFEVARSKACPGPAAPTQSAGKTDLLPKLKTGALRAGETQAVHVSILNRGHSGAERRRFRLLLALVRRDPGQSAVAARRSLRGGVSEDVLWRAQRWVSRIPRGGASERVMLNARVPDSLPESGSLYWCALADSDRAVPEMDETNNLDCVPATGRDKVVAREDLSNVFGSAVPDQAPEPSFDTGSLPTGEPTPVMDDDVDPPAGPAEMTEVDRHLLVPFPIDPGSAGVRFPGPGFDPGGVLDGRVFLRLSGKAASYGDPRVTSGCALVGADHLDFQTNSFIALINHGTLPIHGIVPGTRDEYNYWLVVTRQGGDWPGCREVPGEYRSPSLLISAVSGIDEPEKPNIVRDGDVTRHVQMSPLGRAVRYVGVPDEERVRYFARAYVIGNAPPTSPRTGLRAVCSNVVRMFYTGPRGGRCDPPNGHIDLLDADHGTWCDADSGRSSSRARVRVRVPYHPARPDRGTSVPADLVVHLDGAEHRTGVALEGGGDTINVTGDPFEVGAGEFCAGWSCLRYHLEPQDPSDAYRVDSRVFAACFNRHR